MGPRGGSEANNSFVAGIGVQSLFFSEDEFSDASGSAGVWYPPLPLCPPPPPRDVLERPHAVGGGGDTPPRPPSPPPPPPLPMFEADSQKFAPEPSVPRGFKFFPACLRRGPQGDPQRRGVPAKPPSPPPSEPPSNTSLASPTPSRSPLRTAGVPAAGGQVQDVLHPRAPVRDGQPVLPDRLRGPPGGGGPGAAELRPGDGGGPGPRRVGPAPCRACGRAARSEA